MEYILLFFVSNTHTCTHTHTSKKNTISSGFYRVESKDHPLQQLIMFGWHRHLLTKPSHLDYHYDEGDVREERCVAFFFLSPISV